MEDLEKDIEIAVLPNFIHEPVRTVEWGEWVGPIVETAFVHLEINGRSYLLIEDDNDGMFKEGDPSGWIAEYIDSYKFSDEEAKRLGVLPPTAKALISKRPLNEEGLTSDYICRLEATNGHSSERLIDYMLFNQEV